MRPFRTAEIQQTLSIPLTHSPVSRYILTKFLRSLLGTLFTAGVRPVLLLMPLSAMETRTASTIKWKNRPNMVRVFFEMACDALIVVWLCDRAILSRGKIK
jgi:hypothetical protein